jgi:DNA-binding NarL/FixJ family response regulator
MTTVTGFELLNEPLARRRAALRLAARDDLAARRGPINLLAVQRHLHAAGSFPELFGRASDVVRLHCGFSRAVVLSVERSTLSASMVPALEHPPSDRLRRSILAEPVALQPGTAEAEFIRLAEGGRSELVEGPSLLRRRYGIEQLALGAVMPEDSVLALIVADRPTPEVCASDRTLVQTLAQLVSCSVERLIMRQRMTEFAAEMRYMATSAQALVEEGTHSPLAFPVDDGAGPVFHQVASVATQTTDDLRELLTRRELSIATKLIDGRSNREIAVALHLSPETVKKYVSRVMRKVGAENRADAAVRCLRLGGQLG